MKAKVEEFKGHIPLVQVMFNPGLRDRHWLQMSDIIGYSIKADEDMNLAKMVDMKLEPYLTKFEGISEAAGKEFSLEKAMEKMMHEWDDVSLISRIKILIQPPQPRPQGFSVSARPSEGPQKRLLSPHTKSNTPTHTTDLTA